MKKILLLFSAVGLLSIASCSNDDRDFDTYSETIDLNNVNMGLDANTGRYAVLFPLEPAIFSSDVILAYRWTNDDGFWVWQPVPRTIYLNDGNEVDYDFNFNENSVLIYADATFNLASAPEFINNQTFRVVIVPSDFAASINTNDYDEVMSALRQWEGESQSIEK